MTATEYDRLRAAVIANGSERYVILFDRRHTGQALAVAKRWARDPELSFSDYDFWRLAKNIDKPCYVG